jgi:flagellar protein FliO/FliZ
LPARSCGFSLAFLSCIAQAQTASNDAVGVSGAAMLQTLLSLLLIVGILFAGAYLLRRFNGGRAFGSSGPMRIISGLMLSPRERIVLVEIEDTWLVIGIVPGQIKTLHTLPKGVTPPHGANDKAFGQWLRQVVEKKNEER